MDEQFAPLERLIMCCQPLYDARISELCNKIRSLEFELFWARNTNEKLAEIIQNHACTINCSCVACHVGQRTNSGATSDKNVCIWQPIFENIARECGLTIAPGGPYGEGIFMDANAHLCSGLRGNWVTCFGVGMKFLPYSWLEINKYKNFLQRIEKDTTDAWQKEHEEYDREQDSEDEENNDEVIA